MVGSYFLSGWKASLMVQTLNAELNSFRPSTCRHGVGNHILVSLDLISCSLLLTVIFCILRIKRQSQSKVCTANGFLSFYLGSSESVDLWSVDVSAVAVSQSKPL